MGVLKNKVAIITGGNSGIGKAAAKLFVENGARVVITARRQDVLDNAVSEIGGDVVGICGDVSDLAHHKRVAEEVSRRFGGFDIYFANAGVIDLKPSEAISEASYDRHFDVNTKGVFFGVQTLLPLMRDGGTIIVTSSLAATKVLPDHTVYAGSKAAVVAFVKNWALELKNRRIRANVISPGPTDTEILGKLGIPDAERGPFLSKMAETIPAGRMGTSEELAEAALFLASDASAFINGIDLHVDGGMGLI
ncbi:NAD(P)-dependent dehydrogenase (short-subunit alcohol dehydrogenase family) [Ochrobactrum sp. RC6B]|nr:MULTISPECIES: glucose 1-dehydrogenase [Brucella/Ochrobactrum group]KAB2670022.1 glucose 1-dehydrogenase [Ochrobactrum sp. LMG 5442]MBB3217243.1 NAD(P)-dependent dehydrogenase (short-subunit alcohol dehydrogenase family) [Ochrobactrum sp. RC6B]